jgi:LemA protein
VIENYPDLKASSHFLDLQQQLVAIEDDIQHARRYFNGTVRDYNTRVQMFPSNLVARIFGFRSTQFFELENLADRKLPKVELNTNG